MAPIYFILTLFIYNADPEAPPHQVQAGLLLNQQICLMAADGVERDFKQNAPKGWRIETKCEPKVKGTVGA